MRPRNGLQPRMIDTCSRCGRGVPGRLVGGKNAMTRPKGDLMNATYLVRGDDLTVLHPLAVRQAPASTSPRALIWGVDLRESPSRMAAKRELRQACRDAYTYAKSWPSVVHVVVAYAQSAGLPSGACLATAAHSASRAHAEIERSRGRYVDVVVLDVTGCESGELLRDRVMEAISTRPGAAGDAALPWEDLTAHTIHEAAMQQAY